MPTKFAHQNDFVQTCSNVLSDLTFPNLLMSFSRTLSLEFPRLLSFGSGDCICSINVFQWVDPGDLMDYAFEK